ncbi:hypothetical protein EHM69_02235 [candidate division KSB1 bacterium]|nr:MAG: hypothetical protein EHM69_02235 [candidate division KSB1 bacterium]
MQWPRNAAAPLYVRPSSRVRYYGKDYIVKRDVKGAIYALIGRMTRKLPSMKEAIDATRNQKLVCQWGGYYAVYVRVDAEQAPMILEYLWEFEKKRGVLPPKPNEQIMLSDES